uniref:Uncharacterized protein n=1 Tax=Ciona savignyi TaxID=51511 RepID=H2Z5V7_CIOSA
MKTIILLFVEMMLCGQNDANIQTVTASFMCQNPAYYCPIGHVPTVISQQTYSTICYSPSMPCFKPYSIIKL